MVFPDSDFWDFCAKYDTEEACATALFEARWPNGFRCPVCAHYHCYRISTRRLPLFECASCGRQTSVIAGTVIEGSRTPLVLWFQAIHLLSQPDGISSAQLSRILEVTYKTAWTMSHKIRFAMQQADRSSILDQRVQVQPFAYGSILYPDNKQPLIIGSSLNDRNELQEVKIKQPHPEHVENEERTIEKPGIEAFIREHTSGTSVSLLPRISRILSDVHRLKIGVCYWLNDTFNGIGAKHLQAYLDEFTFRINLQLKHKPIFASLLEWCASSRTIIYRELTREKAVLPAPWRAFGSRAKWRGRALRYWTA